MTRPAARPATGGDLPQTIPYCGVAPVPDNLWSSWNLDPPLVVALAIAALGYAIAGRANASWQKACFWAAWGMLVALFVSPLCAWSSALFSVRVAHHMVLIAAVAPLLVLALPRLSGFLKGPGLGAAFAIHTLLVWIWHAPAPYAFALEHGSVFWAMQISLLWSAIWMWARVLDPAARAGHVFVVLLGSFTQMGLLGALLTFAARPLYAAHFATTAPWGLTPLEDQQLAGLLMWVPAAAPYLLAALFVAAGFLDRGVARARGAVN